jgi:hypothetical protein
MKVKYFNPSENATIKQYNALKELEYVLSHMFTYGESIKFTAKEINEFGPYPRDIDDKRTIANQIDEINQNITFGLSSAYVLLWLNDFEIKEIDNKNSSTNLVHISADQNIVDYIDEANRLIQTVGYKHFGREYLEDYKKHINNKVNTETKIIESDKGLEI